MDEVKIHLQGGHPVDVHCDEDNRPCNAFLLLANIPADPPGMLLLNYGSSSATGNLLMGMFQRSVHESPELAWVIEQVARGIIKFCDEERSRWPSDGVVGSA